MPFFLKPCLRLRKKKRRGKISKTINQTADVTSEVTNTEILHDCMSSSSNIINVRNNVSNINSEVTQHHSSPEREEVTMDQPKNSGAQKVCRSISISGYDADKPIDTRIDSDLIVIRAEDAKCELECEVAPEKDEESLSNHGSEIDGASEVGDKPIDTRIDSDVIVIKAEDAKCELECEVAPEKDEESSSNHGSENDGASEDDDKPIDTRRDYDLIVIKAEAVKCELECEVAPEKDKESSSNHGSGNDGASEDDVELMNEVESLLTSLCDLAAANCAEDAITTGRNEDYSLIPYNNNNEKLEIDADLANEIRRATFTMEFESLSPSNFIDTRTSKAIEIIHSITVCSDVFEKIEELKALEFFDIEERESAVEKTENVITEVKSIDDSCAVNGNEEPKNSVKSPSDRNNDKRKETVNDLEIQNKHNVDVKEHFINAETEHGDYGKENEHANSETMHDEKKEKFFENENKPNVKLKEYFNNAESEHGDYVKGNEVTNSLKCRDSHYEQREKDITDLANVNYKHRRNICNLRNENETKNLKEIACGSIFEREKKGVNASSGKGDMKKSIENGEKNKYFSKLNSTIRNYDLEITEVKEYVNNEGQASDSCDVNENGANSSKESINSVKQGSVGEGGDIKNYTIFTESSKMDCNISDISQRTVNGGIPIETFNISESHEEGKDTVFSEDCFTDQQENAHNEDDNINMKSERDISKGISDATTDSELCTMNEFDDTAIANETKSNACEDTNCIKGLKLQNSDEVIFNKEFPEQGLLNESFDSENEDDANLQNQHHKTDSVVSEQVSSGINDQTNINSNNIFIEWRDDNSNSNENKTKEFNNNNESPSLEGTSQDTKSKLDSNLETKTNSIIKDCSNITCATGSNEDFSEITLNSESNVEKPNCKKKLEYNFKEEYQASQSEKSMALLSFKSENEKLPEEKHDLDIESLSNLTIITKESNNLSSCKTEEEPEKIESNKQSICFQTCSAYENSEIDKIEPGDVLINEDIPNRYEEFPLDYEISPFNSDAPADALETFDLESKNDFSFDIEELFSKQLLGENSISMHAPNPSNKKSKSNENIRSDIGDCTRTMLPNTIDNNINCTDEIPMHTSGEKLLNMENVQISAFETLPANHRNCKEEPFFLDCTNHYAEDNKDNDDNDSEDSDNDDSDESDDSAGSDSDDSEVKNSAINDAMDYNYNKWLENMKHGENGNDNFNDTDYSENPDQTEIFSSQNNSDSNFLGDSSSKNKRCDVFNSSLTEKNSFSKLRSIDCNQRRNDSRNEKKSNAHNFMKTVLEESCSIYNNSDNEEISHPFSTKIHNQSLQRIASKVFSDSSWKASTSFNFTQKRDKSINKFSFSSPSDSSDSSDKSENGERNDYLRSKGSKCFVVSECGDNKNFDILVPTEVTSFEIPAENSRTADCLKTSLTAENLKNQSTSKKLSVSGTAVESKYRIHITNKTSPKPAEKITKTNKVLNNTNTALISDKRFSDFLKKGQFEKYPIPAQPHENDNKDQDSCHRLLSKIENIFTEIEKKSKFRDFDEIEVFQRQFRNKFLSKKEKILSEMGPNIRDVPIKNGFNVQSQFYSNSKSATGKGKTVGKSQFAQNTREAGNRINDCYKPPKYRNGKTRGNMDKTSPKIYITKCQIDKSSNNKFNSDTDSEILTDQSAKMTPDRKRILDASRDIRSPKLPFKVNKKSLNHTTLYRGKPVILRPSKVNLVAFLTKDGDDSYKIKRGYKLHNSDMRKSRTVDSNPDKQDSSRNRNYPYLTSRATSPDELKLKFDDLFKKYASRGRPNGELISNKRSTEWLRDAGVIGKKITMEEANDVFKCIAGVKVVLNKGDYRHFLQKLTSLKRMNYFDIYERLCSAANERQD